MTHTERLLAIEKAAADIVSYEASGSPEYLDWDAKFDALKTAMSEQCAGEVEDVVKDRNKLLAISKALMVVWGDKFGEQIVCEFNKVEKRILDSLRAELSGKKPENLLFKPLVPTAECGVGEVRPGYNYTARQFANAIWNKLNVALACLNVTHERRLVDDATRAHALIDEARELADIIVQHPDSGNWPSRKLDVEAQVDERKIELIQKLDEIYKLASTPTCVSYEYDPTPTAEEVLARIRAIAKHD